MSRYLCCASLCGIGGSQSSVWRRSSPANTSAPRPSGGWFTVAGDDGRDLAVAFDDQFVEVAGFGGFQPVQREVVDDEKFDAVHVPRPFHEPSSTATA